MAGIELDCILDLKGVVKIFIKKQGESKKCLKTREESVKLLTFGALEE